MRRPAFAVRCNVGPHAHAAGQGRRLAQERIGRHGVAERLVQQDLCLLRRSCGSVRPAKMAREVWRTARRFGRRAGERAQPGHRSDLGHSRLDMRRA